MVRLKSHLYFLFCSQSWDLVQQTQNYLKLLLHIINSDGRCLTVSRVFGGFTVPLPLCSRRRLSHISLIDGDYREI